MRKVNAAILTSALSLAMLATLSGSASPSLTFQECTCQALDGSCSVTITCTGGCERYCGEDGDCYAECSGFYGTLALETNLELTYGSYSQLTSLLAHASGQDISFSKTKSDGGKSDVIFDLGFKKAPLWNALEFLSDRGTVRIGGKDFESIRKLRKALLSGKRFTFGVKNTPLNTFVTDLAGVTGLRLRIGAGNPMAIANVELREATLDEIIYKVSEQTGTKIMEDGAEANSP